MQQCISRDEAENDTRLHPLMNFMISWGRDIPNWEYIQSLGMYENAPVVTLYRGINPDVTYQSKARCESWTRCKEVAKHFGSTILEKEFTPQDIVFDTRYLATDLFTNFKWQQEVIIKPH